MVDGFLVAALLGLNVTVSVCAQDLYYNTLKYKEHQNQLLSYHFCSLDNLIGVASFEELSKTCCHLQKYMKWQKIDNS